MATAQNVDRGYWISSEDGRDGAGVVYGAGAVAFAQGHAWVSPYSLPAVDGIGDGEVDSIDFNNADPITFKIQIPNPKPAGKHLRVVLTWDSNPVLRTAVNNLSDLDLVVTDGGYWAMYSESWEDNVEMVDVPNSIFSAGSVVDARILKQINRMPGDPGTYFGSRTNFFYYAIGWTWVKDHAD